MPRGCATARKAGSAVRWFYGPRMAAAFALPNITPRAPRPCSPIFQVCAWSSHLRPNAQTWNMGEHGLGALGVMFGSANAAAMRGTQNHRTAEPPLCAVAQPRGMVHQLIDAGINKSHELDLADRFQALCRHADAESADKEFR